MTTTTLHNALSDAQQDLLLGYLYGELDAQQQKKAEELLASEPKARELFDNWSEVEVNYQDFQSNLPPSPQLFENVLAAATAQAKINANRHANKTPWYERWFKMIMTPGGVAAVMAVVLLGFGLVYWLQADYDYARTPDDSEVAFKSFEPNATATEVSNDQNQHAATRNQNPIQQGESPNDNNAAPLDDNKPNGYVALVDEEKDDGVETAQSPVSGLFELDPADADGLKVDLATAHASEGQSKDKADRYSNNRSFAQRTKTGDYKKSKSSVAQRAQADETKKADTLLINEEVVIADSKSPLPKPKTVVSSDKANKKKEADLSSFKKGSPAPTQKGSPAPTQKGSPAPTRIAEQRGTAEPSRLEMSISEQLSANSRLSNCVSAQSDNFVVQAAIDANGKAQSIVVTPNAPVAAVNCIRAEISAMKFTITNTTFRYSIKGQAR